MVLTPSKQQLRHREVGWERSWTAKHCTDEQKSRRRQGEVDKLTANSEVRHHQQRRSVNVAGVVGKLLFLSGEICLGVVRKHVTQQRKKLFSKAEVSRRHSTDEGFVNPSGRAERQEHDDMSQLGMHPAAAANPQTWACRGRRW